MFCLFMFNVLSPRSEGGTVEILVQGRETVHGLVGLGVEEGVHLVENNGVGHLKDMVREVN